MKSAKWAACAFLFVACALVSQNASAVVVTNIGLWTGNPVNDADKLYTIDSTNLPNTLPVTFATDIFATSSVHRVTFGTSQSTIGMGVAA